MNATTECSDRFVVRYRITVPQGADIETCAHDIALEQTVEVPADCVPPGVLAQGIVGHVESIDLAAGEVARFDVGISYRCDITGFSIPQWLNVIFGNISIKKGIKVTGIDLPPVMLERFGGPLYGIEGIRRLTNAFGRPLASTALKPVGLSIDDLAKMAGGYARGGIDIIKEDHGMALQPYHPFEQRIARCQQAIENANAATGGHTLYFPMISGGFDEIESQVRHASQLGIRGILVAPFLIGLDTVRALSRRYGMIVMAHPAFSGTHFHDPEHGMTPAVLLGTIFRLIGCDISVFPNAGGRFSFTTGECADLAAALRCPLGQAKPSFPAPAGGMKIDRIGEMASSFGPDTVLLIGGSLMQHSPDPQRNAEVFMNTIRSHYGQGTTTPALPAAK